MNPGSTTPLASPHYQYLADVRYFDPINDAKHRSSNDTKEILAHRSNFQPTQSRDWHSIRKFLESPEGRSSKLFLIGRHGQGGHNVAQEKVGLDYFNAIASLDNRFTNPSLTEKGEQQAEQLGKFMEEVLLKNMMVDLKNVAFYSSPLHRCISTAKIAALRVCCGHDRQPLIQISDKFREWLGWEHNAASDYRGTKEEIERAYRASSIGLVFEDDFPEDDEMFKSKPVRESWVNVRKRWERGLDWIFENDDRQYICLFGNNRSLQCGLHVMGLPLDDVLMKKDKKITVMNMENCAMLAFVVHRNPLTDDAARKKENEWEDMEKKEHGMILDLKDKERNAVCAGNIAG